MSSSSTSLTPSDPIPHRPPSACSIASNSSAASAVSLTRRPGIRARSRTHAGNGPQVRPPKSPKTPRTDLPILDKSPVQDLSPAVIKERYLRLPDLDIVDAHDLHGKASGSLQGSDGAALDATVVAEMQPSPFTIKLSKATEKASSLPDIVTNHGPSPSVFFREPVLTPVNNVRDSVSTEQSGTSSSVYPFSFSSAPDSPTSPRTMSEIEHFEVSSYEPEDDVPSYEDDVSYRLRLLVQNNYFLPPAHSKPLLSNLAAAEANKKPPRATTPTFLDIFRVNKSRSRPSAPGALGIDPTLPMLRATGDSIMSPRPQPHSSSQIPRAPLSPAPRERMGRVVVVREKMEDLSLAAKQAEQEMKSRGVRLDLDPPQVLPALDDVIDPTDAVDLPLLPSSSPFAVQTSALRGLGVEESVGAAVLAERLPPPNSPGLSTTSYDADDDWRKALLHQAVHHSLDSTPDMSTFSQIIGVSTPVASPRPNGVRQEVDSPSPAPRLLLQQKIVEKPFRDDSKPATPEASKSTPDADVLSKSSGTGSREYVSFASRASSRPSSYLPARVETPSDPVTPLSAPPRKHLHALFSQSHTHLPAASVARPSTDGAILPHVLRKTMSSPMLSDSYEASARSGVAMTPPPMPTTASYSQGSSHDYTRSNNASRNHELLSTTTSESQYSDEEYVEGNGPGRSSAALSAMMSRPSLSEYSQPSMSPTTSEFQDVLNNAPGYHSATSSVHVQSQVTSPRDSPAPRNFTMSPPPRISSSLAHVALPPPPRGSSLRHVPLPIGPSASYTRHTSSLEQMLESAAEELTPTLPDRWGKSPATPLTLRIPPTNIDVAVHSAPPPSSPTSFFDSIQSQPNALDDLDSSSEGSGTEEDATAHAGVYGKPQKSPVSSTIPPITRQTLMRLGNHSTPYISRTARSNEDRNVPLPLPFGVQNPRQPIANVPQRSPVFQRAGKSDHGHGTPAEPFDFFKYSEQQHLRGPSADQNIQKRRPATADQSRSTKTSPSNTSTKESLRRLDGLLQQHIEAEKDTIRRIACTLQSTNPEWTPTNRFKS
ncbi:hypothetical protein AMATHDRAFT_1494 [Amanita thiersii Skay4041]|uniref:Uncharacterized protein n=1 Tax=Amanita thiersii Skay4041 TaxID=703135 RepID=A0A2A9NXB0_9AGAR|nr:hypothetical protein AMATHDRAFT_1494 [Amanita thiersii Skay4041]